MNINMGKVRKSMTGKCKSNESPSFPHVALNYSSILLCPKKRKEKKKHTPERCINWLSTYNIFKLGKYSIFRKKISRNLKMIL